MPPLDAHGGGGAGYRPGPAAGTPRAAQTYPRRYPPHTWTVPVMADATERVSGAAPSAAPSAASSAAPSVAPATAPVMAAGMSPQIVAGVARAEGGGGPAGSVDPRGWRLGDTIPAALAGLGVAARLATPRRRADPSPSRLAYRLNRLWLTPLFRRALTMGLPSLILAGSIALYLSDDARRATVTGLFGELRLAFENRPEFRIETLAVHAETPEVARAVEERLGVALPASSFHLDLDALRQRVEALDAVQSASLRVRAGGALDISVIEREPAFVWRSHAGLALIDNDGHRVALISHRSARPDLPLLAGDGAPEAVAEARRILAAAEPLGDRLHALLRVGERRWDLVLVGDRRIMLPPRGAVTALERVLALDNAPMDLLARDLVAVDMRNPDRPTMRLSEAALAELHRNRSPETGDGIR